tara:strand:+ start:691 stop:903 length:213 start_codon:yes stop_codon:yes gene_type:complete
MAADSLKIEQNADGTFTVEWDKNDPNWSWMNNHTSKEIQDLVQEAVKLGLDNAIPDYTELPDDKQSQRKP